MKFHRLFPSLLTALGLAFAFSIVLDKYALHARAVGLALQPRFVATTGVDSGDCSDSANPCRTIQFAVNAANDSDQILVAGGLYTDLHRYNGLTQTLYISKSVYIFGARSANDWAIPHWYTNPTVLDAQMLGRGVVITGPIAVGIEGFYVVDGSASEGAGILIVNATLGLNISTIATNTASWRGGGIFAQHSRIVVDSSRVLNNLITDENPNGAGAGIAVDDGSGGINLSIISGNRNLSPNGDGGGIYANGSSFGIGSSRVTTNSAETGGGIYATSALTIGLLLNTITGNNAHDGGGIYVSSPILYLGQNLIAANSAIGAGGGIYMTKSHAQMVSNAIIDNYATQGSGVIVADFSSAVPTI